MTLQEWHKSRRVNSRSRGSLCCPLGSTPPTTSSRGLRAIPVTSPSASVIDDRDCADASREHSAHDDLEWCVLAGGDHWSGHEVPDSPAHPGRHLPSLLTFHTAGASCGLGVAGLRPEARDQRHVGYRGHAGRRRSHALGSRSAVPALDLGGCAEATWAVERLDIGREIFGDDIPAHLEGRRDLAGGLGEVRAKDPEPADRLRP